MGLGQYVDQFAFMHHCYLNCLHTFWHAIVDPYIFVHILFSCLINIVMAHYPLYKLKWGKIVIQYQLL